MHLLWMMLSKQGAIYI